MFKKIFISLVAFMMLAGVALVAPQPVRAACDSGSSIRSGIECAPADSQKQSVPAGIKTAVNTLLFVVGVAAVIVLIVGGLRFILAGGNPSSISGARDSILYAVIGIVVSILAYAIVNFVLGQFRA